MLTCSRAHAPCHAIGTATGAPALYHANRSWYGAYKWIVVVAPQLAT